MMKAEDSLQELADRALGRLDYHQAVDEWSDESRKAAAEARKKDVGKMSSAVKRDEVGRSALGGEPGEKVEAQGIQRLSSLSRAQGRVPGK